MNIKIDYINFFDELNRPVVKIEKIEGISKNYELPFKYVHTGLRVYVTEYAGDQCVLLKKENGISIELYNVSKKIGYIFTKENFDEIISDIKNAKQRLQFINEEIDDMIKNWVGCGTYEI